MAQPQAEVLVWFLLTEQGGRQTPPSLNEPGYRPHLRVAGDGELLGVEFCGGPAEARLGAPAHAKIIMLDYPGVAYEKLAAGAEFEILEGARKVGSGVVTKRD